MFQICTYHWLPIAANMLPSMKDNVSKVCRGLDAELDPAPVDSPNEMLSDPAYETRQKDILRELTYRLPLHSEDGERTAWAYGRINGRGFAQHTIENHQLETLFQHNNLGHLVIEFENRINEALMCILELRVLNKFAVIHEGILTQTQYFETELRTELEDSAKQFLSAYGLTALIADEQGKREMPAAGTASSRLGLVFPTQLNDYHVVFSNPDLPRGSKELPARRVIFYSRAGFPDCFDLRQTGQSQPTFYYCIYRYCALLIYQSFLNVALEAVKQIQKNLIPVRRGYVRDIKALDDDAFQRLREKKTYMAYVTNKIKVMEKIRTHLIDTCQSAPFQDKVSYFRGTQGAASQVLAKIGQREKEVAEIISDIYEKIARMPDLVAETGEEAGTLSSAIDTFLEAEQSRQRTQLLDWQLDVFRSNVELSRGGKNRANALKFLTVATFANLGVLLFAWNGDTGDRIAIALWFVLLAILFVLFYPKMYEKRYSIRLPVNRYVDLKAVNELISSRWISASESEPGSRASKWVERVNAADFAAMRRPFRWPVILFDHVIIFFRNFFELNIPHFYSGMSTSLYGYFFYQPFDISLTYIYSGTRHDEGYLRSIAISTEHWHTRFNDTEIVLHCARLIKLALKPSEQENQLDKDDCGSFVAVLFDRMNIAISAKHTALTWLLSLDNLSLTQRLDRFASRPSDLPERERTYISELMSRERRDGEPDATQVLVYVNELERIKGQSSLRDRYQLTSEAITRKITLLNEYAKTLSPI